MTLIAIKLLSFYAHGDKFFGNTISRVRVSILDMQHYFWSVCNTILGLCATLFWSACSTTSKVCAKLF